MNTHTSRGWLFLLLAALAGIAMLFAACGGGDDDDGGDDGNDATATADEGDDDDGDDEEETGEPTEDSGDDGGDDGSDNPFEDLSDLTGDYANVTGKVTYETSDEDGVASTFVIYSDADNNRSRFDSIDDAGGVFSIISTAEATYSCTATDAGGTDGVCIESEGSDDPAALGLFGLFASPALLGAYVNQLGGVDVEESSEEIAGEDANCFSWEGEIDGESGSGKICFAESGVMLLADFESEDGTGTHMQATDVSDDVSDDDFEPPYDLLEIPGQ